MPDHVHFFCVPGVPNPESVKQWCRYWKRLADQCHPPLKGLWQMDIWDTQMRDANHYTEKLSYMRQNPVRRGLDSEWEKWPYKGVIYPIRW
jgi:putative transposase